MKPADANPVLVSAYRRYFNDVGCFHTLRIEALALEATRFRSQKAFRSPDIYTC